MTQSTANPIPSSTGSSFRSAKGLVRALTLLFCARAVLAVFIVLSTSRLLNVIHVDDSIFDVMPYFEIALFGITVVTFFAWMSRSSTNARARGARGMRFGSKAWAWFFVPVLNLVRPYQAIKELYEVSANGGAVPFVFMLGWGSFLTAISLHVAAHRVKLGSVDDEAMAMYADLKMVAALLGAIAALSAWRVVVRIFEAQERMPAPEQAPDRA